jgi:D-sedoheptulose 7-phosphate isomerase
MANNSKSAIYLAQLVDVIKALDVGEIDAFVELLDAARRNRKHVFVMGNGGSAATATHLAGDLMKAASQGKNPRFRAICLSDNLPTLMAWANDISYDCVFVEPLTNLMEPGDLVVGISGSGNSANVLRAIEYANANGGVTVGLTGYSGGRLKPLVQHRVHVDIEDMQKVEDVHMIVAHVVAQVLCQKDA